MGIVLPFIWTKSLIFFLIGIIAYPILWFVADKEPHFFEVLRVSFGTVRATKNRKFWGGDSFGARPNLVPLPQRFWKLAAKTLPERVTSVNICRIFRWSATM